MTHSLQIGNTTIPYEVRCSTRTSRKRIVVTPEGVQVVVVPGHLLRMERLEAVRTAFDHWLRSVAERDMLTYRRRHESKLGVKAKGYRLSDARTLWRSLGRDESAGR